MAKKTKAGGKQKRKVGAKGTGSGAATEGKSWNSGDRVNSKLPTHQKSDGKFKPARIEKKRG